MSEEQLTESPKGKTTVTELSDDELKKRQNGRKDAIEEKEHQISMINKGKELEKAQNSSGNPDNSEIIKEYEKFREESNLAFRRKKIGCHISEFIAIVIYIGFNVYIIQSCIDEYKEWFLGRCTNNWIVVAAFMVLGLAAIITLGIGLFKLLSSMSSNLKADADANRKLNATIDEKVLGKMG